MIAALFVETGGVYFGLPDVDPWDEARDARLYDGPWPVVAHPPCARWCALAPLVAHLHGYAVGDDGGCFAAALDAVRRFGGVLEHPAGSYAWREFRLPRPTPGGWVSSFSDPGIVSEVAQSAYGHRARKRTWLYGVGIEPAALAWADRHTGVIVSGFYGHATGAYVADEARRVRPKPASRTPPAFRDVLLNMARSAGVQGRVR